MTPGTGTIVTWTRNTKIEDIHHRDPETLAFSHLFSGTLLGLETTYILLAISRLRFMYCAKSLELIGDCCDAAIFRILRSVTSLWNWLRNVIIHLFLNISGKDSAGRVLSLFSRLNLIFKCKDTIKSLIKQIKQRNNLSTCHRDG